MTETKSNEFNYLWYSSIITLFSPTSNLYQITKLYNKPFIYNLGFVPRIFPQQMLLRYSQLHLSSICKDNFHPLPAFGIIGIIQGGIYGHANTYYAHKLGISQRIKYNIPSYFKGIGFAAPRDMISQGIPFMFSDKFNIIPKSICENNEYGNYYSKWVNLIGLSIVSTYFSHPIHNCQVLMQSDPKINYWNSIKKLWLSGKVFSGAESRIALLLVTNILNEVFLKPIWEPENK